VNGTLTWGYNLFLVRHMKYGQNFLAGMVVIFLAVGLIPSCNDKPRSSSPFPSVLSVKITPEAPRTTHELGVIMEGREGSDLTFKYTWKRNGEEIFGETFKTLRPLNFSKHDSISVVVTPLRGEVVGNPVESPPVVVINTEPVVSSAIIQPQPPYTDSQLELKIEASDDDDDYIVYSYQWIKNEQEMADETSYVLPGSSSERGDSVKCRIIPSDREIEGKEFVTEPVIIANSPPSITSQPPTEIVLDDFFTYQVVVDDPDQDVLSFSFSSSVPEGMTIDPETGSIKWKTPKGLAGIYPIGIIATDGHGGRCSQSFNLSVSELKD